MEETFAALAEAFAKIIVWGNYPGGIYPGCNCPGNIPREKLSGGGVQSPRGQLSRGQFYSGEIVRGAIIQGAIVQGEIFRGGNFPWG